MCSFSLTTRIIGTSWCRCFRLKHDIHVQDSFASSIIFEALAILRVFAAMLNSYKPTSRTEVCTQARDGYIILSLEQALLKRRDFGLIRILAGQEHKEYCTHRAYRQHRHPGICSSQKSAHAIIHDNSSRCYRHRSPFPPPTSSSSSSLLSHRLIPLDSKGVWSFG